MADNRVVVYAGPGEVAIENTEYPRLEIPVRSSTGSASSRRPRTR